MQPEIITISPDGEHLFYRLVRTFLKFCNSVNCSKNFWRILHNIIPRQRHQKVFQQDNRIRTAQAGA